MQPVASSERRQHERHQRDRMSPTRSRASTRVADMRERLSVLIVQDELGGAEYCRRTLQGLGVAELVAEERTKPTDALALLDEQAFDCVLLDPGDSVKESRRFLQQASDAEDFPPVLVLARDKHDAAQWLRRGATDVLLKDEFSLDLLDRAIGFSLERAQRLQLQRRLLVAERAATMGRLAAGVAHEVNNPAAYVVLNLELLEMDLARLEELPEGSSERESVFASLRELTLQSREGLARIRTIVSDMKQLSYVGPKSVVNTSLDEVAGAALRLVGARQFDGEIETQLASSYRFDVDEGRLVQVVVNLLSNAVDAAATPGRVRLRTFDTSQYHVLSVEDDGAGIVLAERRKVFEPFYTTKDASHGSGLGLALCNEYVEKLQGSLDIEESELGGAKFVLKLPVDDAWRAANVDARFSPELDEEPERVSVSRSSKGRVLVVDDERALLGALQRLLGSYYQVDVAPGPAEASSLMRRQSYDLVLCDLALTGRRGVDLYQGEAQHAPEIEQRFLFWTGGELSADESDVAERTGNPVLFKPLAFEELLREIDRALGRLR